MKLRNAIPIALALLGLLPSLAFAQTASTTSGAIGSQQGIFGCNQNGAYAMSVGALAATGGVFVPVADATTELNTGILVYKECVLRPTIDRMREAAMVGITKTASNAVETGRDGKAQYVKNAQQELLEGASDPALIQSIGVIQATVHPAFQAEVARAVALSYEKETRAKDSVLNCPYEGDLKAAITNPTGQFSWEGFRALSDPACNPLGSYYLADTLADNAEAACMAYMQDQWDWGRGYYPVLDDPNNPCNGQVVTPAVNVQENIQTIYDSPVHQMESANDVGQMITALYAGMTTQMIADNRGMAGLSQSIGGQPSYMDQLVFDASRGVRDAALNTAITILNSAKQVEAAYLQAVTSIGGVLTQTMNSLRTAENQCWNLIIPKVCSTPLTAENECNDADGVTYKIATSTAGYAQGVINARIAPLVPPTVAKITASQNAMQAIDNLIAGVSGTASLAAQKIALQQLDSLVAQRALHVPPDVDGPNGVVRQLADVRTLTNTLIEDTVRGWTTDPPPIITSPPTIGWCNYNSPSIIQAWKDRWRK